MADRTICRISFLAFCLLPTLLVGGWAVVLNSAPYRESLCVEWEQRLSLQLGLRVQVESVRRLRDGVICLGQVALLNPENDLLIAQADNVRLRAEGRLWHCGADGLELRQSQIGQLWQSLRHLVLLRTGEHPAWQLRLQAPTATVELPAGEDGRGDSESLADVRLAVQVEDDQQTCQLQFFWQGGSQATFATLQVARLLQESGPATKAHLQCDGPLPCRLLSSDVAALTGPDGEFEGQVDGEQVAGKWRTEVKGRLSKVELSRLAPHSLPINGRVELHLDRAQLDNQRLTSVYGRISGGPGSVAGAALNALAQYVQVEPVEAASGMLPFERLSCDFWLDRSRGLALRGTCNQGPLDGQPATGAILVNADHQPLLHSKEKYASPYALLIGLSYSAADADVLQRRAPYPSAPRVASGAP